MNTRPKNQQAGAVVAEIEAPAKPRPDADERPEQPPRYAVVIHDDDITFTFVILTLVKVLKIGRGQALRFAHVTDRTGRCAVWSGLKEHAELKAQQITGAGPDPFSMNAKCRPLKATIEPIPGT